MASPAVPLPGLGSVLLAQVRYQLVLLMRTPRALVLALFLPAVMLALELTQGQHASGHPLGTTELDAVVSGLVVFGTLSIAYVTFASGLVAAREEGILRRWHMTPLPRWGYFAGRILASVLLVEGAAVALLVMSGALGHLHLSTGIVVSLLVAITLGAITLAAAGTAVTALITSVSSANPVLVFTYVPLLIFSGAFGALTLPAGFTTAMSYFPVEPVIHAVKHALQASGGGFALISPRDLAVLGGWTLGSLLIAVRFFSWDPPRPGHSRHAPAAHRAAGKAN